LDVGGAVFGGWLAVVVVVVAGVISAEVTVTVVVDETQPGDDEQ